MKWLILKDPSFNPEYDEKPAIGKGQYARPEHRETVQALEGAALDQFLADYTVMWPFEFRLKDDDGEVYYEGKCGDLDNADESEAFGPLDWAMADSGCTTMEYRKVGMTRWKVL